MLLAVDFDEYLMDEESVAIAPMFSHQSPRINGPELETPESNRFSGYNDASLFDIAVAQIEAKVEPDGIGNDVRWKSVVFISIHPLIPSI